MKSFTVWAVAVAICLVSLGWLAARNPRAIPIGALFVALVGAVGLGALAVGNAGAGNPENTRTAFVTYVSILVVLAGLAILNLYLMRGSLNERFNWAMGSMVIWLFVVGVIDVAWGQAKAIRMDVASQAFQERARRDEAEVERRRGEVDRHPERRRAVLDSVLSGLWVRVAQGWGEFDHYAVFGDPAKAPGGVVVWAVVTVPPTSVWGGVGVFGENMHRILNREIRERGYTERVALGFAPKPAVDSAGGDQAYFGLEGANVIPQYPAEFKDYGMRPIEVPKRR